jgi:hypothetical protein
MVKGFSEAEFPKERLWNPKRSLPVASSIRGVDIGEI